MASSTPVGRSLARSLKKVEAPRPLKDSSLNEPKSKSSLSPSTYLYSVDSAEKLVALMDMVVNNIAELNSLPSSQETTPSITASIANLCKYLKIFGPQLENSAYHGQLDRAFSVIREYMVRPGLECEVRANLLEIVELRSCNWITRKSLSPGGNYLNLTASNQSLQDWNHLLDANDMRDHSRYQPLEVTTHLGADELLVRSGKYREKSTKCKNYFKDEIIIRNSDSGKVMGIQGRRLNMIEMLSETIISFQRVSATAKERLVQITGSNDENVSYATRLIEDTIRNNASTKSGSDSSFSGENVYDYGRTDMDTEFSHDYMSDMVDKKLKINSIHSSRPYQYKHKVIVRNCHLTITGDDYNYVTVAKAVLDDYFYKLRASKLPDEDSYCDEVFADDIETKGTFDNNFISPAPPPVPERSFSFIDSNENNLFFGDKPQMSSNSTPLMWGDYVSSPTIAASNDFKLESKKSLTSMPLIKPETTKNIQEFNSLDDATFELGVSKDADDRKLTYTKEFLLQCSKSQSSREKPVNWEFISRKFPLIADTDADDGKLTYTREFLLQCSKSQASREKPVNWEFISRNFPQIVAEGILLRLKIGEVNTK